MTADDFDFEFGSWTVRHRRLLDRLAGRDEWEQFDGTTTCAPILGGIGNLEEVSMPTIGALGMALRLFDQETHVWSIYWSSNHTGRLEPPVRGRFVDGIGVFEGDDEWNGQPIRVRFVWESIDPDTARWTQSFRSLDAGGPNGGEWEVNWVMDFSRS